jgi:hypothetical protein
MTFDGWVDHLLREMLAANTDDWFRVRAVPAQITPATDGCLITWGKDQDSCLFGPSTTPPGLPL